MYGQILSCLERYAQGLDILQWTETGVKHQVGSDVAGFVLLYADYVGKETGRHSVCGGDV